MPFNIRDMIVAIPRQDDPMMANDSLATRVRQRLDALEDEAHQLDMELVRVHSHHDAADRLIQMAA